MGAVSIAVLSFLGFDGISTLSEETKGGVDTVGKASLGALMLVGTLFIAQTWIAADLAQGMKFGSLDTAFYDTANLAGGQWLKYVTMWSTVISWGSPTRWLLRRRFHASCLRWLAISSSRSCWRRCIHD